MVFATGVGLLAVGTGVPRAVAAAPPNRPILDLTVTSSGVNLLAREARLADVLLALGQQAGVKMVLGGGLDTLVTETLVNVPVDAAIKRLGRWHSVVLIYEGSSEGGNTPALIEARVTGTYPGVSPATPAVGGPALRNEPRNETEPTRGMPVDRDPLARTLIAIKGANAEVRTQQMEDLVKAHGEHTVVAVLREVATRDPAPRMRRAAIQVLASIDDPAARAAVQAALSDANAGVRSEARAALRRQGHARAGDPAVD